MHHPNVLDFFIDMHKHAQLCYSDYIFGNLHTFGWLFLWELSLFIFWKSSHYVLYAHNVAGIWCTLFLYITVKLRSRSWSLFNKLSLCLLSLLYALLHLKLKNFSLFFSPFPCNSMICGLHWTTIRQNEYICILCHVLGHDVSYSYMYDFTFLKLAIIFWLNIKIKDCFFLKVGH